ncbi:MAG: hypothetical protein VYA55_22675 [Pseudomonadota bacterium]|nr:hypothetical protein [Pseudomonadota bacterium]
MNGCKQALVALLCSLVIAGCMADDWVLLSYAGLNFSVPPSPQAMGVKGDDSDFFVVRYGAEKSKQYVAFTRFLAEPQYQCDSIEFVRAAFGELKKTECDQQEVTMFAKVFANDKKYGLLKKENMDVFYSELDDSYFLFLLTPDKSVIKIDSDFLSEADMKRVIGL